jgi:transcription initiation factor TFIID subunit 2
VFCRPPGRSIAITSYLIDVIRRDSSLTIRRHVARLLSEAILVSLALGEIASLPPTITDMNAEAAVSAEARADAAGAAIVTAVRKDFAKRTEVKNMIFDTLM